MTFAAKLDFCTFMFLLLSSTFISGAYADTIVGGNISNETWTLANSPYIVTSHLQVGVADNGTPPLYATLTIEPGVVVKVNSGRQIVIGWYNTVNQKVYRGRIRALGTSAAPIQFIANTDTPTQGYWSGIYLSHYQPLSVQSEFTYVSIKHASIGITTAGSPFDAPLMPLIHHTTFEQNTKGMSIGTTTKQLNMYQNNFVSNGSGTNNYGLTNGSTNAVALAPFCWWNSATGPSLTGGGTAQRVSTNVIYEPYLSGVASPVHYFTGGAVINKTFNPNIGANFRLQFQSNQTGNWTVSFLDGASQVVRTFTGAGSNSEVNWDGKNTGGTLLPNGNYTYKIESTAGSDVATPGAGPVILDTNRLLSVTSFTSSATIDDSFTFNGSANFDDPVWTLRIKNSINVVVRTATGTNSPMTFTWNGKDDSNNQVPDGNYTAELQFAYGGVIATSTINIELDDTNPATVIVSPTNGQLLSNIYNNGSYDFPIIITVTDLHLSSWTLKYRRIIPCCTSLTQVATGTTAKNNATVYTFLTRTTTNNGDQWEFQLSATDVAGNTLTVTNTVSIGHLKLSVNVTQFNPSQSGTATFTTIIPFDLLHTILIKNSSGQTVRTLIQNAPRSSGTYNDPWDGRNDSTQLVPDGPFFYVAQVTVNGTPYSVDDSSVFPSSAYTNLSSTITLSPTNDPFSNLPLVVNYTVSQTSRIVICVSVLTSPHCVAPGPGPGEYQVVQNEYQASGSQTYKWVGLDLNGIFRPEAKTVTILATATAINSVFVYGTKSVISSFVLSPPVFSPLRQSQNLSVNFSTYQSQLATITATFRNQQSSSLLRTIVVSGVTPGQAGIPWDGKTDSGVLASPGVYIVTLTIQDPLGNQTSAQLLSTVKY